MSASSIWDWTPETLDALRAFLGARGEPDHGAIGDGHSNLTYLVTGEDLSVVVRRPPPPPAPPGAHDVLREARVIAALQGTGVPVPDVLAVAQAGEVLDVPFYVMSYVEGAIATTDTPPGLDGRAIAFSMVDTLKALHTVDWRARGLEGFGRPEGFNGAPPEADGAAGRDTTSSRSRRASNGCRRTSLRSPATRSCTATSGSAT